MVTNVSNQVVFALCTHIQKKYTDLPKRQHAVPWRKDITYSSMKSDGFEYDTSVSTFVGTRVLEIRRFG